MENFGIIFGVLFWGPLWLFASILVGQRAAEKGRSFAAGFVFALLASPLVGAVIVRRMAPDCRRMTQRAAQEAYEKGQRERERMLSPIDPPRRR